MSRMSRSYTVILQKAEGGWWVANVPLLHATAQGKTRSIALKRAQSLTQFAIDSMRQEGSKPPAESRSNLEVVRIRAAG